MSRDTHLGIILAMILLVPPCAALYYQQIALSKALDRVDYYTARSAYYFDGANERGLLDICLNDSGEENVWFKEDCDAHH